MYPKTIIVALLITIYQARGAILLWSRKHIEISPLERFSDEHLEDLVQKLGDPEVVVYKSTRGRLQPEFQEILDGFHTAFTANDELHLENYTVITGVEDEEFLRMRTQKDDQNTLSILIIPRKREKRDAPQSSSSSSSTTEVNTNPPPGSTEESTSSNYKQSPVGEGPVFYKGKFKNNNTFGLMYSTEALTLKTNSTTLRLGNTSQDMIYGDNQAREKTSRLNIIFPIGGNKITLRFTFQRPGTYWTLTSVKITDTNEDYNFDLVLPDKGVTAPPHFSYHCTGTTVFSDNSGAELRIEDMQVQIDSPNGAFQDAYDCVSFTTAPIWAGIFVTAILGVVLSIGITAIMEIKTMDKFDNAKTKNLAITIVD